MTSEKPATIDDYIANFPADTQEAMELIRKTIKEVVPEAEETISYGMPTFTLNDTYLLYFAGYKNHIGLYPAPVKEEAFKEDFAHYKTGRGSIQFPLDKPMPIELIVRIVKFRKKENMEMANKKG